MTHPFETTNDDEYGGRRQEPTLEEIEAYNRMRDEEAEKCPHDPREYAGKPIGMYHCPLCGCMCLAGLEHPKEFV